MALDIHGVDIQPLFQLIVMLQSRDRPGRRPSSYTVFAGARTNKHTMPISKRLSLGPQDGVCDATLKSHWPLLEACSSLRRAVR